MNFFESVFSELAAKMKDDPGVFNDFCAKQKMTKQAKLSFKNKLKDSDYKENNLFKILDLYGISVTS